MEDISEEGTSRQPGPMSSLEDMEKHSCDSESSESMDVEETMPKRVRTHRKSANGSPENGGKVAAQRGKKSSPENRGRKHTGSKNVRPRPATGRRPLGQEDAEASRRRKTDIPKKHRKTTGHYGLNSQAARTSSGSFSEEEDDETDSSGSEEAMRHRVRSEVRVPPQRQRSRSRVRFDASEDKYYTCVSDGEDEDTIDDSSDGHLRRPATSTEGRKRVSDQGGESPGGRGSGDRKCRPLSSCSEKKRRGSREGGESSSDSENDEEQQRSHRPSSTRRRGREKDIECKPAKRSQRSRREVTPQSLFSDGEASVSRRGSENRRKIKSFSGHSRRPLANVKLGRYDGSTCLATFLAKFENCSQYYSWNEEDRLFQLRASLEGPAGQILWDAGRTHSVEDVVKLLRTRFGSEGQPERFRAELKARRRQRGESLQNLYQDICRLVALAYPGPSSALLGIVGRDAFLEAIDDQALKVRILEWEPKDLDEALQLASRFEAYGRSFANSVENVVNDDKGRTRGRHVRSVTSGGEPVDQKETVMELSKQIQELRVALAHCQNELKQRVEVPQPTLEYSAVTGTNSAQLSRPKTVHVAAPWGTGQAVMPPQPGESTGAGSGPFPARQTEAPKDSRGICYGCGQPGHFRRSCPLKRVKVVKDGSVNTRHIAGPNPPAEVYLKARIGGERVNCLMDSGSERSLIGRKLIPGLELEPVHLDLYAANDTLIPLLGKVTLTLQIGSLELATELIVVDNLEEVILGYDWLSQHQCQWDFARNVITVLGETFQLRRRATRAYVRRIYVAEDLVIPARHQANVPVKVTKHCPYTTSPNWVVEAKSMKPGVVTARTLLAEDTPCAAIRVINYSDNSCKLSENLCVGTATPVNVCETDDGTQPDPGSRVSQTADRLGVGKHRPVFRAAVQSVGRGGVGKSAPKPRAAARSARRRKTTQADRDRKTAESENGGKFPDTVNTEPELPEHVRPLYEALPSDLTEEERLRAIQFIRENAADFSTSEFDIGRTELVQHRIDTGNHKPFRQALRRHPMAHLPVIDQHVQEMLQHDIVEPAASPWSSNIVLIRKSDGGLRFCVDYRQLNELTYKDTYPLPRIDMCLNALGGSRLFSTLDLRAGYWQTLIDERDRDKTCFVTRKGTYRFKVLSFGLANAPALFQRLMDLVLVGLTWEVCLVYLDDVIIMSENFDEHLRRLKIVFERLHAANLKLKASKCKLFQREVVFLGHLVTADGIAPDPAKIRAVQDWPRPRNLTETRAFVGLASYYRNHIEKFAEIARPLHELTKKYQQFQWTDRQEEAFCTLKRKLTEAPILASPRDEGTYVLDTDASDSALGASVQQWQDGELRVIGYASRALSDSEKRYCTTRKELLAVIFGLKQYRQFLLARENFVIRTDHAALTQLKRTPEPVGQQARWLDLLAEYNFEIKHRPGTAHRNVDALSRRPCERELGGECRQCQPSRKTSCFGVQEKVESENLELPKFLLSFNPSEATTYPGDTSASDRDVGNVWTTIPGNTEACRKMSAPKVDVSRREAAVDTVENEFSGQTGKEVQVASVTAVDHVDDRTETDAGPTDDDVIHVFNRKSCVDADEIVNDANSFAPENLRQAQANDPDIAPLVKWKSELTERPCWNEVAKYSDTAKNYWAQWDSLEVVEGILYRNWTSADGREKFRQLIVPHSLQRELVARVHGVMVGGHFGIRRTQHQFQRRGYFLRWRQFVEEFCKHCVVCAKFHRGKPPKQSFLKPIDCGAVNERWHCDLSGPYPASNGFRYICVCVDAFSRYLVATPIRDKSAMSVAKVLVRDVITKFGCFRSLQTDNGKEYQNEILQHICELLHIDQLRITSYRPSGNGRCEIINKTLHSLLGKVVAESQRDWSAWLPMCVLAYNTSRHESTGMSPYYLMYSRQALVPLDLMLERPEDMVSSNYHEYAEGVAERMRSAYKLVQDHQGSQIDRMKRNYNVGVKLRTFELNDLVYYYYPRRYVGRTPKWTRVYDGIFRVEKKVNDAVYVIRKTPNSKPVVANVDKLKLYCGPPPKCWKKILRALAENAKREIGNRKTAPTTGCEGSGIVPVGAASENAGPFSGPPCSQSAEVASENAHQRLGPQNSTPVGQASENVGQFSGYRTDQPVGAASENAGPFSGPLCYQPAEAASENLGQFSGPRYSASGGQASENSEPLPGPQANPPAGQAAGNNQPANQRLRRASEKRPGLKLRLPSSRVRRRPTRYCCVIMESRKKRVRVSKHFCQICGQAYRSQGSCYKHQAKRHAQYYKPGKAPEPIPPDEMHRLNLVFASSDRNSRQRRQDALCVDDATRATREPRADRSRKRPRTKSAAGKADRGPTSTERSAEVDLADVSPLSLSPASQRQIDEIWSPSAVRVRSIRTAAAHPEGYESAGSSLDLPQGFSRPESDVSDGQSTSPARRRQALMAPELVTPGQYGGSYLDLPYTATRPAEATPERLDVGVNATVSTVSVGTAVRPSVVDVAVMAVPEETREDRSTSPPTVEEMAAWQLPPQVDLEGIATLMVLRPTAGLADLQRTVEANLPRADTTAYGAAATRLAFQAMRVYERNLAEHLRRISTVAYLDDATGWTGLRRCGEHLNETLRRSQPPPPSADAEVAVISSDED